MTKRRKGPTPRRTAPAPWTPFRLTRERANIEGATVRIYENSRYLVTVVYLEGKKDGMVHLSFKNLANTEAAHDWRDMQRIKNELVGAEREAVELFPRESRLADTANQYHLWVAPEGYEFPFGFPERFVLGPGETLPEDLIEEAARQRGLDPEEVKTKLGNIRQRPFEQAG